MKNLNKNVLASIFVLFGVVLGFSSHKAEAAAPVAASAILQNTVPGMSPTVDLVITGTDFSAFISSTTTTANGTDLAKIHYKGATPTGAIITTPGTVITATFLISSIGTNTVATSPAGDLVIDAGAIKDGTATPNLAITVLNGSITDNASPIVVSVSPTDTSTSNDRMNPVVITFSEPMTTGSFAFATTPVLSYAPTWSNANKTVSLSHNTFNSGQLYHATISVGTDAASGPNPILPTLPYLWSFTTTMGSASSTITPLVVVSNMSLLINGGTTTTNSRDVVLTIAATNAASMIISNNPFFTDSAWENYAITKNWTLGNKDGMKIVYVKFISTGGVESDYIIKTIDLVTTVTPAPAPVPTTITITATTTPAIPATPAVPKTENEGCKKDFLFSSTTGQACIFTATTPAIPATPATVSGTITTTTTNAAGVATVKTYNFGTMTLKNGSKGEPVKELQRFLNKVLNLNLAVDGKLGAKTVAIIKKWQKDNGLTADGLIGAKTKEKMNKSVQQ